METTIQIDFQNCDDPDAFRQRIEENVTGLEARFGRITACRIFMRGPGQHHRTRGAYEVRIHLELPDGRQVDIDRTPDEDERQGDPWFAINDAFKRARRMLQDNVRRMQGQVKQHEEASPVATVRRIFPDEGYGFLETGDGRELYFHRNSVLDDGFARLKPGTRVVFAEEMGDKGPQASMVRQAGKHSLR